MSEFESESELLFGEDSAESKEPEPAAEVPMTKEEVPHKQQSLLDYLTRRTDEQSTSTTIGDRLGLSAQHSVDTFVKKVDDLRTVININDKFSFMSELFRNNMRAYNDFIMQLNSMTSREEALMHVKQVASEYGWNEGSATVQSFWKIFDKKF